MRRLPFKPGLIAFLFFAAPAALMAQDDPMDSLLNAPPPDKPVNATFKDSRLINFHTIETAGKRTLDFRISHRFGNVNTGLDGFFGIDGPASIRLALEYSYDGRLQFGLGRSNVDKQVDGYVKYRLLRQSTSGKMPLSVTLLSAMYVNAGAASPAQPKMYDYFTSRLSFCNQVMIARKFTDNFSAQVSPTILHYNMVQKLSDRNDVYVLPVLARMKFSRRSAITAEYSIRLNNYRSNAFKADPGSDIQYHNSASLGLEVETGGHVFSVHLSNSFGITEAQSLANTTDSWTNGGIKIGFNISRAFTVGAGSGW